MRVHTATASTAPARTPAAWTWLARLGSLKLTLVVLLLLGTGVVWAYRAGTGTTWPLVAPLALFALNLGAAIATRPIFRRQMALLVFHLALLAIIVLVAAGRLTYLKGRAEVSVGETFQGHLVTREAGPLHAGSLEQARFTNLGFSVDYGPGIQRRDTANRVSFPDGTGLIREAVIGDQVPLTLHGYRFYTTPNKGFAPTFTWQAGNGNAPVTGTVHLPSYPLNEYRQARAWPLPGSDREIWVLLEFDGPLLDPSGAAHFGLPETHRLLVRDGETRRYLAPGDTVRVAGGALRYEGLGTWMGYTVFYDWTLSWLLAACLVAVLALGWHFWIKFSSRPWTEPDVDGPETTLDGTARLGRGA